VLQEPPRAQNSGGQQESSSCVSEEALAQQSRDSGVTSQTQDALGDEYLSSRRTKSATRGGRGDLRRDSTTVQSNVFALHSESKNSHDNLLSRAENTIRKPKIFSNMRLQWTARKQGRNKAEAAPDISSLPGGLFNPSISNSTTMERIRPGTLRVPSSTVEKPSVTTVSSSESNVNLSPKALVPNYQPNTCIIPTCYFWDRQQKDSSKPPCMRGAACDYLHSYHQGAPIASRPLTKPFSAPSSSVQPGLSGDDNECHRPPPASSKPPTCFFWDRYQKDNTTQPCTKGDSCTFMNEHRIGAFVAHPPIGPRAGIKSHKLGASIKEPISGVVDNMNMDVLLSTKQAGIALEDHAQDQPSPNQENNGRAKGLAIPPSTVSHAIAKPKTTKINLGEYQRQKALKLLNSGAKEVIFGSLETKFHSLQFDGIDNAESRQWKNIFLAINRITFTQMFMVYDLKAQQRILRHRQILEGSLLSADPNNTESNKVLTTTAHELALRSAGLISFLTDFAILVYPAKNEEWKFLEEPPDYPSSVRLRYFIFQWNSDDTTQFLSREASGRGSLSLGQSYKLTMVKRLHNLDLKDLLPLCESGQNPYNFFLFIPQTEKHNEDFIVTWIRDVNSRSNIHSARNEGAWGFFSKTPTIDLGVVLVSESALEELHKLPGLFNVVQRPIKRTILFWCISDSNTYPLSPLGYQGYTGSPQSTGRINVTQLFPLGCAFLLTPSFLVAEPQMAYELLRWFLSQPKPKYTNTTPRTWKVVCCYRLADYLLEVANSKVVEKETFELKNHNKPAKDAMLRANGLSWDTCELRFKIHALLVRLDNQGLLEPSLDSEGFSFDSGSESETELPIIYASRHIDPDDEPALIGWFAHWSLRELNRFKKFVVVGTDAKSAARAIRMRTVPFRNSDPLTASVPKGILAQNSQSPKAVLSPKERALVVAATFKAPANTLSTPQSTLQGSSDAPRIFPVAIVNQNKIVVDDAEKSQDKTSPNNPLAGSQCESSAMGIDSNPSTKKDNPFCEVESETELEEFKYQTTVEWYEQVKQQGGGWEHIYIAGYEKSFRNLGINEASSW
jgi:hypothetical protein